ncbi:hypothetical protein L7F22_065229 [Adiantum nelumboides]|nr:hypothetical protein [Adiantum nelumboides]
MLNCQGKSLIEHEQEYLTATPKQPCDARIIENSAQLIAGSLGQGCERDAVGAGSGSGKELNKNESYMRLSWALVHSRQVSDVQRGILMLEASLEKKPDEVQQREILYLLAVGNYRAGDIPRARRYIDHALLITPDFRQGLTLRKMIEDKIAKDGVIGIGIAAAAASVVAGVGRILGQSSCYRAVVSGLVHVSEGVNDDETCSQCDHWWIIEELCYQAEVSGFVHVLSQFFHSVRVPFEERLLRFTTHF